MRVALLLLCLLGTSVAAEPLRPKARVDEATQSAPARDFSILPKTRPDWFGLRAKKLKKAQKRGSVCGVLAIQGKAIGRVPGRINACGIKDAVRVTSVSGISLSTPATLDCRTAKTLNSWVSKAAIPAFRKRGGGLVQLRVAASYACRTRNNQPGAKVSEHGKGRAIDISGFRLRSGETVSILKGWRSKRDGKRLRGLHRAACGPFGTVLGPDGDRFHQDHLHFDTARYRSGSFCR